jgi:hypothetical protein
MKESKRFFAAAFCSLAGLPIGCGHATAEIREPAQSPHAAEQAASPTGPEATSEAPATEPAIPEDPYATAVPRSAKSIGHTSYVLKVTLEGGLTAAYKPGSTLPFGRHRYKGEIAAYRLARALGLANVPRAIPRAFAASSLHDAFSTPKGAADFARKAVVDSAGLVHGALMPWIPEYTVLPLEESGWRARWERWLMDPTTRIADSDASLAASISTLIIFDFVTANWDRWSGGNVARAGADGILLFVDNDGAFYEHPAPQPLAEQLARVRKLVRFSREFVSALRSLDDAKLRAAMAEETPGLALLSDHVLLDVESRVRTVLTAIDACVGRRGDSAFLP